MPGQLGSLRLRELTTLQTAIAQRRRVIMLSGAGGMGKSTLAREALASLAAEDPGRPMLFIEVDRKGPGRLAAELRDALGETLDATERTDAGEPPVVVLDAAEQMLQTEEEYERLLALAAGTVVIVTTRRAVALPGAVNIVLRGLETHPGGAAVRLLRESPHLDEDVSVRTSDYDLSRIARAVHGNPLALNVVAALFAGLAPREILERLNRGGPGFLLDESVSRSGVETRLRDVVAWGIETLPADARIGLCALAEFTGWTSADSFEGVLRTARVAVASAAPGILGRVARAHLVETADEGGLRRVRLLDTVRDTVREMGSRIGFDRAAIRRAHHRWYTAQALHVGAETAHRTEALRRIGAEAANYVVALAASAQTDPAAAARAAAALGPWLLTTEYCWTGLQLIEEMLAGDGEPAAAFDPADEALLRSWRARLRIHLGGREELPVLREIARTVGVLDDDGTASVAAEPMVQTVVGEHLAYAELRAGDPGAAIRLCATEEARAESQGLTFRRAQLKYQLARAHQQARHDAEALREAVAAEQLAQSLGDESLAARCALTRVQLTAGLAAPAALQVIRPLVGIHLAAGDRREACHGFLALASAEADAGDHDAALAAYRQALRLARHLRYWHGQLYAAMGISLSAATDDTVPACLHLAESVLAYISHVRALLPPSYVDGFVAGCDQLRAWAGRLGMPPVPPLWQWPGIVAAAERLSAPREDAGRSDLDRRVHQAARHHGLSERERRILILLARGLSDAEIAARLGIAAKTLRNTNSAMYRKLGVRTRAQAAALAHAGE